MISLVKRGIWGPHTICQWHDLYVEVPCSLTKRDVFEGRNLIKKDITLFLRIKIAPLAWNYRCNVIANINLHGLNA